MMPAGVELGVPGERQHGRADLEEVALVDVLLGVVGALPGELGTLDRQEPSHLGVVLHPAQAGVDVEVGDALAGLVLGLHLRGEVAVDAADDLDGDARVLGLEVGGQLLQGIEPLARVDRDRTFLGGGGDQLRVFGGRAGRRRGVFTCRRRRVLGSRRRGVLGRRRRGVRGGSRRGRRRQLVVSATRLQRSWCAALSSSSSSPPQAAIDSPMTTISAVENRRPRREFARTLGTPCELTTRLTPYSS